ncbi:hypothetical protein SAMN06295912_12261 [Sphingomonas laterariae]|uniref:Uncharacterized protein n=1 Tax=Edaphosphingomonas laterariae TaxID=861865 RepID=A0A239I947_9SPHN|nr:hypothetical protein [Sphingomonas laterariae]SNS90077.1 hypothetical protein SAMN06295912_12261 [Sphingomonas laterariae]
MAANKIQGRKTEIPIESQVYEMRIVLVAARPFVDSYIIIGLGWRTALSRVKEGGGVARAWSGPLEPDRVKLLI